MVGKIAWEFDISILFRWRLTNLKYATVCSQFISVATPSSKDTSAPRHAQDRLCDIEGKVASDIEALCQGDPPKPPRRKHNFDEVLTRRVRAVRLDRPEARLPRRRSAPQLRGLLTRVSDLVGNGGLGDAETSALGETRERGLAQGISLP
ncbi:hypothetical protein [Mycobacterium sp.]|uniref:hypothetical protein n=1 Tax=Mycobacterium sp. TaxID=1785 RepID=UPI003D0ED2CE